VKAQPDWAHYAAKRRVNGNFTCGGLMARRFLMEKMVPTTIAVVCLVAAGCTMEGSAGQGTKSGPDGPGVSGSASGSSGTGATEPPGAGASQPPGQPTGPGAGGSASATGDNGDLFPPDASTTDEILKGTAGTPGSGTPDASSATPDGGSTIPGDGNTATAHVAGYTLVFTQKGTDVTLVVSSGNCSGTHKIEVHEGYACDDPTKGPVWGGSRGTGIFNAASSFTCDAATKSATYTRSGADPATNWTVADHNPKTDVTLHPILVDNSCGTFF
jgi:hypothetical protein